MTKTLIQLHDKGTLQTIQRDIGCHEESHPPNQHHLRSNRHPPQDLLYLSLPSPSLSFSLPFPPSLSLSLSPSFFFSLSLTLSLSTALPPSFFFSPSLPSPPCRLAAWCSVSTAVAEEACEAVCE